jgi:Zn-dependent protease
MQVAEQMGAGWTTPLEYFLRLNIGINLVLAVFNMIPLYPLDGSWVLSRFLSGELERAYASLRPYSFFILIVLLLAGVLDQIIYPVIGIASAFVP